jgi:hypothetical protein
VVPPEDVAAEIAVGEIDAATHCLVVHCSGWRETTLDRSSLIFGCSGLWTVRGWTRCLGFSVSSGARSRP